MADALDGLDVLDWAALQAAYGPAVLVPTLVRKLLVTDVDVRAAALAELWGTVWHQGTVYESTAHVVPFLAPVTANVKHAVDDPPDVTGKRAPTLLRNIDQRLQQLPLRVGQVRRVASYTLVSALPVPALRNRDTLS